MFFREIVTSITLLSFFQLVFSKRSANNLYSYLYPQKLNQNRHHCRRHDPSSSSALRKIDSAFGSAASSAFTFFHANNCNYNSHGNRNSNSNSDSNSNNQQLRSRKATNLHATVHPNVNQVAFSYGSLGVGASRGVYGWGSNYSGSASSPWGTKKSDRNGSRVTSTTSGSTSTSTSTQRNLFSFNLNDIINGKENREPGSGPGGDDNKEGNNGTETANIATMEVDVAKKDKGLSLWTKRIINYQPKNYTDDETTLLASDSNGDNDENNENDENKKLRSSFSLSSLINVEALLLASGQVPLDGTNETDATDTYAGIQLMKDMIRSNSKNNDRRDTDDTRSGSGSGSNITPVVDDDVPPSTTTVNISTEEQLSLNALMQTVQQNIKDLVEPPMSSTSSTSPLPSSLETAIKTPSNGPRNFEFPSAAEYALKEATQSIEEFMTSAASINSPEKVQTLIASASRSLAVDQNADVFKAVMDRVVMAAESLARDQGVDVSDAAAQARATTRYTTEFLQVANGVLVSGYVRDSDSSSSSSSSDARDDQLAQQLSIPPSDDIGKPLFNDFESVCRVPDDEFKTAIEKASDMALLSGAIYEDIIPSIQKLEHSLVANGTSGDVVWMVTDNIGYGSEFELEVEETSSSDSSSTDTTINAELPTLVRTITVRGFDASDENVDRELLLNQICDAAQVPLGDGEKKINVHKGLMKVAKEVYKDVVKYIDMSGPNHKIVLNGHSIGGAISNLILLLLVEERGADFVNDKVLRVFTYGSPPIATLTQNLPPIEDLYACPILTACNIQTDKVYGYAQPWDPIVRMFSPIDALYPLIGDLGDDGVSLYASGPPRTLRPITRAILESWSNWPTFRDDYRGVLNQEYMAIGVQHLLMPETGRYLQDRVVNVNVATFPIDDVLRVSSRDLYSALETAFPLDTFAISLVPTAVRSFIHHFYPAYTDFADYTSKKKRNMQHLE